MLAVNDVGKPCAGEPHARIDGRELETEHTTDHGDGEELPNGKPSGHTAPTPTAGRCHRASSRPSKGVGQRGSTGQALVLVSDGQPGGLLRQRGAARGANWSRTVPTLHPE